MMRNIKINRCLAVLFVMFISAGPVSASPRIVVSIPSLHSLVSALMEGVAEPQLLLSQDINYSGKMDPFQKSRLITADIVIWVGPGLEAPIVQALDQLPSLDNKMLALSDYVPLLPHNDLEGSATSRQVSRDLKFWSDPRLAIMAIRMITPRLVRLDPKHQELYLDNEIALIKKLKILEQEITTLFAPYTIQRGNTLAGVDRYFSHRFVATTDAGAIRSDRLRKVSMNDSTTCVPDKKSGEKNVSSRSYYFETMRLTAKSVYSCFERHQRHATTSNQVRKENHMT